jgi:predicted dienelactone hydrolase
MGAGGRVGGWRSKLASILVGALLLPLAACGSADPVDSPFLAQRVTFEDGEVLDPDRTRRIPYRIHYPVDPVSGFPLPVVMVSHGGFGNPGGHRSAPWLGPGLAARGYVVLQLAHLPSASTAQHLDDRPRDVSHVLDRLGEGTLPLPRRTLKVRTQPMYLEPQTLRHG